MSDSANSKALLVAIMAISPTCIAQMANGDVRNGSDDLQEVVVTAQKRSEKLMDVPMSVSAIAGESLEALHIDSLGELAGYVPGMAIYSNGTPGLEQIVIRGVNSSAQNFMSGPTVGTYIDDLPVGSSTGGARGGEIGADLNPYDLDRIEVLKGPQGTLYGADTLGGLVRYILRRPDLDRVETRIGAEFEDVDGSRRPGWAVRGALNVPLVTDRLAMRVSGFSNDNAGYIDNVRLGIKDANRSKQYGGLASLLWQPTESFLVRSTILSQDLTADDLTQVSVDLSTLRPLYGRLKEGAFFLEPFSHRVRNYSVSADWNLGVATLTSSAGWSRISNAVVYDLHDFGVYCAPGAAGPGWTGCPDYPHGDALAAYHPVDHVSKFVEETRLTSPENRRIQWILGAYYTKEDADEEESIPTFTPSYVPLPPADNLKMVTYGGPYKELAGFADLTYKFTDWFDAGGGGRYSAHTLDVCTSQNAGLFGGALPPCTDLPSTRVVNWMASLRFHLDQNTMMYARVATGVRPGFAQLTFAYTPQAPANVKPDRTTNYEMGVKGEFFDRRLQFDAAVFYIKWTDIQLSEIAPSGFGYGDNAGKAISKGFEATTTYRSPRGLRVSATLAYTDAHLTEDAPNTGGKNGDQLPVSPRWTGSATADYVRPVGARVSLLFGGGYRYRDKLVLQFPLQSLGSVPLDQMNIVDVYSGMALRGWTMRLYAVNVLNDRSYTGVLAFRYGLVTPVQPRTIGFRVDRKF